MPHEVKQGKVTSKDYAKSDHFNLVGFMCLIGVPVLVAC